LRYKSGATQRPPRCSPASTDFATCSSGWSCGAPVAGYWLPGRGRAATTDWDIEGGHAAAELSRAAMRATDNPGRLAQHGVGLAMVLGGPALYLLGVIVTTLLAALAVWELRVSPRAAGFSSVRRVA
jgi:hypothetical protein